MSNGESVQGVFEGYDGGEDPLPSYAALAGLFNLILALFLLIARKAGRPVVVLEGWDLGEHVVARSSPREAVEEAFGLLGG